MIREIFSQAIIEFKSFLTDNSIPNNLVWLFKEDVSLGLNEEILINTASISDNELIAERYYEIGKGRNFGIGLNAFCKINLKVGCTIILPDDVIDSEYKLLNKNYVKYSFNDELVQATFTKPSFFQSFKENLVSNNSTKENNLKNLLLAKKHL